jgi:hypothetical protein
MQKVSKTHILTIAAYSEFFRFWMSYTLFLSGFGMLPFGMKICINIIARNTQSIRFLFLTQALGSKLL